MVLVDITLGIVAAASFSVGLLLYKLSKEEIDPILSKISFRHLPALAIIVAVILGIALAAGLQTEFKESFALGVFAIGVVLGSLALPHSDRHRVFKHAVETTIAFMVAFFGALAYLQL